MLTFANPWFLLLLLTLPLLAWRRWTQRRAALRYADTRLLTGLPVGQTKIARWAGVGLRTLMLLLLIIALAGPRWPDLRTRLPAEGIAIEMVVDVSGSMNEEDFPWQDKDIKRLDAVKKVFRLFVAGGDGPGGETLEGRPHDLIGLITFADRPENVCPLTLSHAVLLGLLDDQKPRADATNIGDGIAWGLHRLENAGPRRRVLVLLTDGYHNVAAPAWTPRQAAQIAARYDVPIYAIDAGRQSEREGEKAEDRKKAIQSLQEVARMTNGKYFEAGNVGELLAACQEIDRLERADIETFRYRRYHEGYVWFGLAAFVVLMAVQALELTIWRRLP